MAVTVACPHCRKESQTPGKAGQTLACPHCGKQFQLGQSLDFDGEAEPMVRRRAIAGDSRRPTTAPSVKEIAYGVCLGIMLFFMVTLVFWVAAFAFIGKWRGWY